MFRFLLKNYLITKSIIHVLVLQKESGNCLEADYNYVINQGTPLASKSLPIIIDMFDFFKFSKISLIESLNMMNDFNGDS